MLLIARVIEVRMRFLAVLAAVGLFIGYWDAIKSGWDALTRPPAVGARQLAADQEFFCPMDPKVLRSTYEPNGNVPSCPVCGMPLSIRRKAERQTLPAGVTGRVQISPERIQLAGIRTVAVGYQPLWREIATAGNVVFDVSRVTRVFSRVSGQAYKVHLDRADVRVAKDDPLVEIRSPNLAAAAKELLQATGPNAPPGQAEAAKQGLRALGLSDAEIDGIVRSGNSDPRLVVRAPRTGFVVDRNIVAGSNVESGALLMAVADESSVWIETDVYEKDMDLIESEVRMEAVLEAFPHRTFTGRFRHVYPRFGSPARTFRVRFEVDNPQPGLRGGMYAAVRLSAPLDQLEPLRSLASDKPQIALVSAGGQRRGNGGPQPRPVLAVPADSVIDTGAKTIVYVRRKQSRPADGDVFEGVEVRLGPRGERRDAGTSAAYYPVLDGLRPGDEIAAAGAFLVDAETRLNPGVASQYSGGGAPQSAGTAAKPVDRAAAKAPAASAKAPPSTAATSDEERQRLAQLSAEDRALAERQRLCPISGMPLASMDVPYKIVLRGQPVLLCCKGCAGRAKAEPEETLRKVEQLRAQVEQPSAINAKPSAP